MQWVLVGSLGRSLSRTQSIMIQKYDEQVLFPRKSHFHISVKYFVILNYFPQFFRNEIASFYAYSINYEYFYEPP
jgi:hypothetical protein